MDALLRFRSAALEAQFWASGPVRAALLGADRVALFVCICNNALSAYAMAAVGAAAELRMHYKWAALFVGAQLLSTWCIHRHEDAYYRRRDLAVAFHRLTRIASAVPYSTMRNVTFQVPAPLLGSGGAGGGMWQLAKTLILRGGLPFPWIFVLNFPVPFPLQVLYTALLALALAAFRVWPGADVVLPMLADSPQQREAVCRLHRGIQMLMLVPCWPDDNTGADAGDGSAGGAADACPPSASALVVFWSQLVGLLAPLAVVYVIELRAKSAFLYARGLEPPIAARSVALGMAAAIVYATQVAWLF